jgi:hypothetical protein
VIPFLEKSSFGDNNSLISSPSSTARLGMCSDNFLAIVVLPEQGSPVIQIIKHIKKFYIILLFSLLFGCE